MKNLDSYQEDYEGRKIYPTCCVCGKVPETVKDIIKETREHIDYILSHTYCRKHYEEAMSGMREEIKQARLEAVRKAVKAISDLGLPDKNDV